MECVKSICELAPRMSCFTIMASKSVRTSARVYEHQQDLMIGCGAATAWCIHVLSSLHHQSSKSKEQLSEIAITSACMAISCYL